MGRFSEIPDVHADELPRATKKQRGVYSFFLEFKKNVLVPSRGHDALKLVFLDRLEPFFVRSF